MAGGRKPLTEPEEIVRFIYDHEQPAVFTVQVRDEFDYSMPGANKLLKRTENQGYIQSAKSGSTLVWWPTVDGLKLIREHENDNG